MNVFGVIPARYASSRFPGKPMAQISGHPMLKWVIEGAKTSQLVNEIIVATDHEDIMRLAVDCGVQAVMTDSDLPSGSDRVWAAIADEDCDVVVNIQGDEPLINGYILDNLVQPFIQEINLQMATLGRKINPEDLESPNTAKIILNKNNEALYFSRHPIPYSRDSHANIPGACLKHIGMYAYKKSFLKEFCECGPVSIEQAEMLEQLRALYLGAKIRVVEVDADSWGVDHPEDIGKIEELLKKRT